MNILIDELPHQVEIGGVNYKINCDFKTSIKFELLIQESELSQHDKVIEALKLYFNDVPKDINSAIDCILWFYSCGKYKKTRTTGSTGKQYANRLYSFNCDQKYIFSAFMQQYCIDLTSVDLHWWKFKALFESVSDSTTFGRILYYRGVDINSNMSKSEQSRIRRLKEVYALPLTMAEQKNLEELEQALENGDISKFLT